MNLRTPSLPLGCLATALLSLSPCIVSAESFRFSGTLTDAGIPANGRHTLRVVAYDAALGGRPLGAPVTLPDVAVVDGRFETRFELAFDLPASDAWLGIEVRGDDGTWNALGAREPLTADATAGGACWSTTGNAALVANTHFIGTTDAVPLDLRSNGVRTGLFIGTASIEGDIATVVLGANPTPPTGTLGSFVGGSGNRVFGQFATAAGGSGNSAGSYAFAAGGAANCAGGQYSYALGRSARVRGGTTAENLCGEPNSGDANGDEGSFMWSDASAGPFTTTGPNQFVVRSNGGVSINRTPVDPNVELTVQGRNNDGFAGNVDLVFIPSANGAADEGVAIATGKGGAGTNDATFIVAQRNSTTFTTRFQIDADGTTRNTTGAWSTLSDARLKRDIGAIPSPLETLLALRGHTFAYDAHAPAGLAGQQRLGFVAQEVRAVLPQWVSVGTDGWLSVTPTGFEALAVESMRALAAENALLQASHDELAARHASLLRDVEALRRAQADTERRLARLERVERGAK